MKNTFSSIIEFLGSSKRTILLLTITIIVTLVVSSLMSMWLSRNSNLSLPSIGTIKTVGVEVYWDSDLENRTEEINWGNIQVGSSKNFTVYIRSISNVETTLLLDTTDWSPANLSEYVSFLWDYDGRILNPGEIVQVKLTFLSSYSRTFLFFLIENNVKKFSFDIHVVASEEEQV
jgi:hypothetical protein